ncbi:MAG TPA: ABC transporter permease [Acidimicrobiia bacterium]|nr:ABC transporter permease [Acidimicrobiia bacterium]
MTTRREAPETRETREETVAALSGDVLDAAVIPAIRRRGLGIGFWLAVGWLAVLVGLAVLAPVLPFVQDPATLDPFALREGPTADHWLGADDGGRDVFARIIYGGRVSLFIGVASVTIGMTIGGFLGLTAGYFRGRYERVVMSAMDTLLAFPALVLALALVTFLSDPGEQGGSITTVTLALGILAIPALARITRASTLTFAEREFVTAARSLGASHRRILTREILPNVVPPMLSFSLLAVAVVIVAEGALSFLGLSVQAPQPTWGNLIAQGRPVLREAPHIALMPCAVMFVTLLSLNFAGDTLRRRFDVREGLL